MPNPADDILADLALPSLAGTLRNHRERVLRRWDEMVKASLPDAQPLSIKQVRDSIPEVLERLADALESSERAVTRKLYETTQAHGVARFDQDFDLRELVIEYRILRWALADELRMATGGSLTVTEVMALDVGVDIALQQAVLAYVAHLKARGAKQ